MSEFIGIFRKAGVWGSSGGGGCDRTVESGLRGGDGRVFLKGLEVLILGCGCARGGSKFVLGLFVIVVVIVVVVLFFFFFFFFFFFNLRFKNDKLVINKLVESSGIK